MKDYYYILGVNRNASTEEIKTAYRKLAIKFHPDKNDGDYFFENKFKEIQEAYDILSDHNSKIKYDIKFRAENDNTTKSKTDNSHEERIRKDFEEELKKRSREFEDRIKRKENELKEEIKKTEEATRKRYQSAEQRVEEEKENEKRKNLQNLKHKLSGEKNELSELISKTTNKEKSVKNLSAQIEKIEVELGNKPKIDHVEYTKIDYNKNVTIVFSIITILIFAIFYLMHKLNSTY